MGHPAIRISTSHTPPVLMQTYEGTVKKWISHKGFGFLTCPEFEDVFVHVTACNGRKDLNTGEKVTFEISTGNDGRQRAENVNGDGSGEPPEERSFQQNSYGNNDRGSYGQQRSYGNNNQGSRGNNICYNFRDQGSCRFGDDCRFSHDVQG